MKELSESLILTQIARIWDAILRTARDSLAGRAVLRVCRLIKDSFLWTLLIRDSALDAQIGSSLFLRALRWLISLPTGILSWLDARGHGLVRGSRFCQLLAALGRCAPLLLGLLLLAMLSTPYELWNNAYALIGALGILGLVWVADAFDGKRLSLQKLGAWPLLFAAVIVFALLWSRSIWLSWRYFAFAATCMLLVLLLVNTVQTEQQLFRILVCCAAGLAICCLYALYQRASGIEASSSYTDLDANAGMPGRVFSFFKNPNAYANVLVYFAPLMLSMALASPKWWQRLGFLGVFALAGVALIMTYSRAAWLSLAVGIGMMLLLLCPRYVPLLICAAALTIPFWPVTIRNRLLTIFTSDSSISSRSYIYSAMGRIIRQNWFFGSGLGVDSLKRNILYSNVYYATFPFVHAHDILLEMWGECGILAPLAMVPALYFPFCSGCRIAVREPSSILRAAAVGTVSGIVGAMFSGIVDYVWSFPRVMFLFWFVFALLLTTIKLSGKGKVLNHD